MDCARCREVVSARLDGEASAQEEAAADAHLRGCPPCRDLAERMTALDPWIRAEPPYDGPDLVEVVMTRVLGGDERVAALAPVVGSVVPAAMCGCDAGCRCGCRDGRACRCAHGACARGAA